MTKVTDISKKKESISAKNPSPINVNISGIKPIFTDTDHKFRRFIWLIILLSMSIFWGYQVTSRAIYLMSNPIIQSTSDINFKELTFPAVTICNENYYRIRHTMRYMQDEISSRARQQSVYEYVSVFMKLLNEKVINQTRLQTQLNLLGPEFSQFNIDGFYLESSHEKLDMIKRCVFNGRECDMEWFETIRTDAGVCYQFNGNHKGTLTTALRGRVGGLHLELNVEQYEYTHGRTNAAGIQILIQDQSEIPNLVQNTALAIGPGEITSIALRTINRTSEVLERCGKTQLTALSDSQNYTRSACELDCWTRYINDSCGCIHFFMPSRDESVTKRCLLGQIVSCVYPLTGSIPDDYDKICACQTPCHIIYYQISMSRTILSTFAYNVLVRERTFFDDAFFAYVRGMTYRDWGLILDNNLAAADDLHQIVFTLNRTRVTSYHYIQTLRNSWDAVEQTGGCLSSKIREQMKRLEEYTRGFPVKLYPGYPQHRTIEVSIGLAHSLLTQKQFNETKAGQIYSNCSLVASALTGIINEIELTCIEVLTNCSDPSRSNICAFYKYLTQYEPEFRNYSRSSADLEADYYNLAQNLMETVGKLFVPWNDESLDVQFYRDNYAEVDIFFQELSVTEIKEEKPYDAIAFLCDVGGSLGLCLGGSLLTVFEIIDTICLMFCCAKRPRLSPTQ